VAGHAWLTELALENVPLNTAASLDAMVDAALARRLLAVELWDCQLSPASAPAYVRLLGGGLARLALVNMEQLDVPAALLLSNALRVSATLTSFQLSAADLWCDPAAAVLLLGALVSHPTLHKVDVSYNNTPSTPALQAIVCALLAALVAANAPALHTLDISHCRLSDARMSLLVDALPQNNYLRTLACAGNDMTEGFVHDRLRPAVQANASLRKLILINDDEDEDEDEDETAAIMLELQDLVAAREAVGVPQ
jgi:hypothetical protein